MNILKKAYFFYLKRKNPVKWARLLGVKVGNDCRLIDCSYSSEAFLIKIGNHVSATQTHFETHDGGVWVFRKEQPNIDIVKPIEIKDNVYLGINTIVLPGVTIGENSIIGAGSIVTKNVPANVVAAGVPAKVIKSINEYKEKAISSSLDTKSMEWEEKVAFLKQHYKYD